MPNDYMPTGVLVVESADWVIETANSITDSITDSPKIGVCLQALTGNHGLTQSSAKLISAYSGP